MSGHHDGHTLTHSIRTPQNVEQIVEAAKEYEYNAQVPVRYWLRTAGALLKEADIYMREGDDETTYLLLFRHAHLVLAHLEAHPDSRDKSNKPLLAQARREVDRNLKALDNLKPRINQRYERYQITLREKEKQRTAQSKTFLDEQAPGDYFKQSNKGKIKELHGYKDSDLAVQLAQQEFQRRASARETSRTVRTSDDRDDLSRRLQAIRSRVDSKSGRDNTSGKDKITEENRSGYSYPSVRSQQVREGPEYRIPQYQLKSSTSVPPPSIPPSIPLKVSEIRSHAAPPRPEKLSDLRSAEPVTSKQSTEPSYTFAPSAFLENGNPLRTLFLPPTLRTTFLRLAHQNTQANLETCGFLAGTLISNALFVSKLIIPAQVSTSDTCEMTNESQLFDYVDSGADLMILGWIHTHPTQTCFMSSRDLHTHAGYQMMLPESVAIVCAPSKGDTTHGGEWGVFRLTDPPGKMSILNCSKPGIFHPHDVDNIYTDALRPGHVVEAKGLEFEVVDLRNS